MYAIEQVQLVCTFTDSLWLLCIRPGSLHCRLKQVSSFYWTLKTQEALDPFFAVPLCCGYWTLQMAGGSWPCLRLCCCLFPPCCAHGPRCVTEPVFSQLGVPAQESIHPLGAAYITDSVSSETSWSRCVRYQFWVCLCCQASTQFCSPKPFCLICDWGSDCIASSQTSGCVL